jgi:hypothetical protein
MLTSHIFCPLKPFHYFICKSNVSPYFMLLGNTSFRPSIANGWTSDDPDFLFPLLDGKWKWKLCCLFLQDLRNSLYRIACLIKVKLPLCFNWASRHEGVLGEWRYSSTPYLTSALDGGEWSASRPGHLTPRERAPGTYWIEGWAGPRASLDAVVHHWAILAPSYLIWTKNWRQKLWAGRIPRSFHLQHK